VGRNAVCGVIGPVVLAGECLRPGGHLADTVHNGDVICDRQRAPTFGTVAGGDILPGTHPGGAVGCPWSAAEVKLADSAVTLRTQAI
jgi:hypothetical protein